MNKKFFIVTLDQFNESLLIKSINFFKKNSYWLLTIQQIIYIYTGI